ncbi:MAG: PD-(D/E)XK nuclease domain-containing protein [Mangrovibacterium sp.]
MKVHSGLMNDHAQKNRKGEFKFEDTQLSEIALGSFDIENPLPAALLFQTGYLTIREYDSGGGVYTLDYPNKEVEQSLVDALLSAYRCVFPGDSAAVTNNLHKALLSNDVSQMTGALNAVIGSIPYDHWRADHESIFHIIMHLTFKKIGVDIESEVHSSKGRCDVLIKTSTHIYAIELKLNSSAQQALNQIFEKGYLHPYQSDLRQKVAIGINFSSEKRAIEQYLVKEVEQSFPG